MTSSKEVDFLNELLRTKPSMGKKKKNLKEIADTLRISHWVAIGYMKAQSKVDAVRAHN